MQEEYLWVEKYRPKLISETILPESLKKTFQGYVDQKNVPNLLLAGSAGIGKTTVARAMLEEIGCTYCIINGSMNGNIDTLRNDILRFASSVSLTGGRKYVILDESDYLNANSTQPALRNFMEEYSRNCGFILTCNYPARIIPAIHSRCSVIKFSIPKSEISSIAQQLHKRIIMILDAEGVPYEKAVIGGLILKYFPDIRRILNELQRYSVLGKIDSGILSQQNTNNFGELFKLMKDRDFTGVRKWVGDHSDVDDGSIFKEFYVKAKEQFSDASIPLLVVILAKYQYQSAFVMDKEINLAACLAEVMGECEFRV